MIALPSALLPEHTTFRRFRLRPLPPWCRIGVMKLALLSVLAQALLQPQSAFAARRMRSAAEPFADERALVQDGARTWRFGHLTVTALSPFVRGADQYGKTIAFGAFLDESLARPDAPVVEFDEYKAKFSLQADHGWKLVGVPPIIELRMGERASFTVVCTERTDEKDEPVDILLCGVDVRLGSTPEADEHPVHPRSSSPLLVGTTNLDPEEWIDSQTGECRYEGLLTPVSVKCAPVFFPFGEGRVTFQTSRATLYTEIEQADGNRRLVPADKEYPEAEIPSRKFYLLGSAPSTSLRDGQIRIAHSLHSGRDEISFTTFSPDFTVKSVKRNEDGTWQTATKLSDESESGFETNVLRDNWPIAVTITCEQVSRGILPKTAITPRFETVVPTESIHPTTLGEIANHVGTTAVELRQVAGDAFKWWAPKVYWYGKAPTGSEPEYCCWTNRFGYQFVLVATTQDGAASVIRKRYKAGMLLSDSGVTEPTYTQQCSVGAEENGNWNIKGRVYYKRVSVSFADPEIQCSAYSNADSQYREMIQAEEEFHVLQNKKLVSLRLGGKLDLYTKEGIERHFKMDNRECYDNGYYYGQQSSSLATEACNLLKKALQKEINESTLFFFNNHRRDWGEYAAKTWNPLSQYQEALRYHCTYAGRPYKDHDPGTIMYYLYFPYLAIRTENNTPDIIERVQEN